MATSIKIGKVYIYATSIKFVEDLVLLFRYSNEIGKIYKEELTYDELELLQKIYKGNITFA